MAAFSCTTAVSASSRCSCSSTTWIFKSSLSFFRLKRCSLSSSISFSFSSTRDVFASATAVRRLTLTRLNTTLLSAWSSALSSMSFSSFSNSSTLFFRASKARSLSSASCSCFNQSSRSSRSLISTSPHSLCSVLIASFRLEMVLSFSSINSAQRAIAISFSLSRSSSSVSLSSIIPFISAFNSDMASSFSSLRCSSSSRASSRRLLKRSHSAWKSFLLRPNSDLTADISLCRSVTLCLAASLSLAILSKSSIASCFCFSMDERRPMAAAMSPPEPPRLGLESGPPVSLTLSSLFPRIMDAIRPGDSCEIWIGPVEEDSKPPEHTNGDIALFGSGDATINSGDVGIAGTELGLRVLGGVLDAGLWRWSCCSFRGSLLKRSHSAWKSFLLRPNSDLTADISLCRSVTLCLAASLSLAILSKSSIASCFCFSMDERRPMAAAMSPPEPPRLGLESGPPVSLTLSSLFPRIMDAIRPGDSCEIWIGPVEEDSKPPEHTNGDIALFGSGDATINSGDVGIAGTELGLRVLGGVLDAGLWRWSCCSFRGSYRGWSSRDCVIFKGEDLRSSGGSRIAELYLGERFRTDGAWLPDLDASRDGDHVFR